MAISRLVEELGIQRGWPLTPNTLQVAWHQLETLLDAVLELEPQDRSAFLDQACSSNPELKLQAESLLQAMTRTDGFLERPIANAAESLQMPEVVAGQRFGPYETRRLIGVGGMGAVYLATRADNLYEQRVAIKLAKSPLAFDSGMLARFRSERQILANLEHANIARLLDGGITASGIPFLVMEYVEGLPIDIFCQTKKLDVAGRLTIFNSVCAAVEYAHKHLVVHCDIKPANILVNAEGVPKLLDFGIARLLDPNLATQSQSRTVERMMTPEYASPEQIRCEPVTTATDVYALGVLLYKMLTGCLPLQVDKASPLEAARVICEQYPVLPSRMVRRAESDQENNAPSDARRALGGDLDNIVLAALREEPSRRYASVAALAADIEAYFRGYPVKARATSWSYRVRKFVQRNKVAVSAAAALLSTLSGFTIAMTLERNRANREAETSRHVSEFLTNMFKVSDPSVSHGDTVTARELLDKASANIQGGLSRDPQVQARLMQTMGSSYRNLGLYPQSVALLEHAVDVQTKLLGSTDMETLQTMSVLGAAYGSLDRYPESEKLLRHTLAEQQRIVGTEDEAVMTTTDFLADTLTREGQYAEAERLLRNVLAAQRRILGPESRAVLFTNNRLIDNLRNQSRLSEAEKMARESLAINQRLLGSYDFVTLSSIEELALIVINEGLPEEAEKLDREGFRIATHMYGPDNEHTLLELGEIGDALQEQGRLAAAEPIQREVVEHLKKIKGTNAQHTIEMMNTLAVTLSLEKKYAEAESLSRAAMDASLRTLGPTSEQSIDNTVNLGLILAYERRSVESEALFKKAVAASSKAEGTLLANVIYAYAEGMAIVGHSDEAIDLFKQAVAHGFSNPQQVVADEDLNSIRNDARFKAIVAAMH